jgi:hypothetical protein
MSCNRFTRMLNSIEHGIAGDNKGIPIHFKRLKQYLPNIQQSTYYLAAASSKIGKTSFVDDLFFYNPLEYALSKPDNFELDIDYFSFEINSDNKLTKSICRQLWHDFGIIVDVNTILSRGENKCPTEIHELVKGYADYYQKIEDYYTIFDGKENPTGKV